MTTGMDRLQEILDRGTGHKRLDDDLFKTVDNSLKIYRREGVFDIEKQAIVQPDESGNFQCDVNGCTLSFTTLAEYDSHYNSNHRYTCVYCRKLLQSAHFLDLHLDEAHDNFFLVSSQKKPMYRCFIETCRTQFWNCNDRNVHCMEIHNISKSFLQHFGTKKNKKNKAKNAKPLTTVLENLADLNMTID